MRRIYAALSIPALALVLASCGDSNPQAPAAEETDVPDEFKTQAAIPKPVEGTEQIGTPMAERVATIGLLNKRNNLSQDLVMKPGESRRLGNVIVRVSACERTAPWEMPKETGAFVQLLVLPNGEDAKWSKVFSGWLFKESPSLNIVEHPIYDVWVKECAMSFPGDDREGDATEAPSTEPEPTPAPTPAAAAPATTAE